MKPYDGYDLKAIFGTKTMGMNNRKNYNILLIQPIGGLIAGVDSVLLQLIRGARKFDSEFSFSVVLPPNSPVNRKRFEDEGIKVFEVDLSVFTFTKSITDLVKQIILIPFSTWKLVNIIRNQQIDLVHSHKINVLVGDFAAFITGVGSVHTYHEANKLGIRIYRIFSQIIKLFVDRIIVICNATGNLVASNWEKQKKVVKIYNGIDLEVFTLESARPDIVRLDLFIPENVPVILALSRFDATKGIEHYIDAAAIVLKSNPDVHFLMVGDITIPEQGFLTYKNGLFERVKELNIQENFHFTGIRNDVIDIYGLADIFISSAVIDVLPTTVLEAMAMSCPVVATDVGGVSEEVLDGITGFIVPPQNPAAIAEKVIYLLSNPELAYQMGSAGRAHVTKNFSIKDYVHKTLDLYRVVLNY